LRRIAEKRRLFGTPILPAFSMLARSVRLTCWSHGWREWRVDSAGVDALELAAQAASETTSCSEPVFRRSFHDGRQKYDSPFDMER
jgi:hypothetical protein